MTADLSYIAEGLRPLAVPIDDVVALEGNPRRGNVDAVAASLRQFGQRKPLIARRRDGAKAEIQAGNHTLHAAQQLGWSHVAVLVVDDDERAGKAFALADNRSHDLGGYDDALLDAMLGEFRDDPDFGDLLGALQWQPEVADTEPAPSVPDDTPPAPPPVPVTQPGDVWTLGPHRLLCGDCRVPDDVTRAVGGRPVHVAFTSPPYAQQRTYDTTSGFVPIPPDGYVDWFAPVAANVANVLADDGSWFVNIRAHADEGQRVLYVYDLVCAHVRRWSWLFVDDFAWVDTKNGVPGGWPNRFKDAWEPVFHFARGPQIKFRPLANATESDYIFAYSPDTSKASTGSGLLGSEKATEFTEGLARPSNVLHIAATSTGEHAAAFPVDLPRWFARAYSDPGDVLLDPFAGSGSTIIAAERERRIGVGIELSPAYCDVICARYQRQTGTIPERDGSAHDFTEPA